MTTTISRFLSHPELLGRDFAAPSWDAWKVVLKAAFGEQLTEAEGTRFRELADRDPPQRRVRELWLAIGRRAGKDSIASAIATFLACHGDFKRHLRRGETASIVCLAVDRAQAGIVFNYIKGYFEEIPALNELLISAKDDTIALNNGVEIIVATNSFRGIRGKTIAAGILDEAAFWRDDSSANPDKAVYDAVLPAMITLRAAGAMIIGISTVHRRSGLLFEKVTQYLAKDDPHGLALLLPSTALNPLLLAEDAQAEIDRQLELDPAAASAEWLSRWRDDLSTMFDAGMIDAATEDREIHWPRSGVAYVLVADPSGGRGDSFTAAVAHREQDGTVVIDRVIEIQAPFDPEHALDEVADLGHLYRTSTVHHDRYAADFVKSGFRRRGMISKDIAIKRGDQEHALSRSEIYLESLAPFASGRVRLPKNPRLRHQLISLERRPSSTSGHDLVDHPRNGHDDIANAACGCIALLSSKNPFRVSREIVARASLPPGSIVTYPTDTVPICTTDAWHNASPMERMTMSAIEQQQRREPSPERRTSLYISPGTLTRSRNPGAWSDRAGIGVDSYRSAAAAWPIGGVSIHDVTDK